MDDDDDYESVPDIPSNVTVPSQPTNVLNDAFSIILCGLAFFAVVALNVGAGFMNYWLISSITSMLGTNHRNDEAQFLTAINGVICALVIFFTAIIGFEDRGFIGGLWHAFVVEAIILAFLLVVELVVIGLYCCANADWSKKKTAEEVIETEGSARPMVPRSNNNSTASKSPMVPRDEARIIKGLASDRSSIDKCMGVRQVRPRHCQKYIDLHCDNESQTSNIRTEQKI